MRAARRRMRYETWFYLHFYTYLAIALAFSHQFATGADFMTDRAARAAWALLYLGVGCLLVWYRFVTPAAPGGRPPVAGRRSAPEAPGVVSVYIQGSRLHELGAEPGQFFRWRFLTRELGWAANPYSLSAPVRPDLLRITVKDFGDHSAALARMRPGTRVLAEGPYGSFTAGGAGAGRCCSWPAGSGSHRCGRCSRRCPAGPARSRSCTGPARPSDLVFEQELGAIARARGAAVYVLVGSRAELGADPLTPAELTRLVPDLARHDVYLCGPDGMTAAVTTALRAAGVPRRPDPPRVVRVLRRNT